MSFGEHASIDLANGNYIKLCVQWSTIALLYYDYAATLPQEIELVWRAKFRLPTLLYICCRYALIANALYLLIITDKLGSTCHILAKFISTLSVFGRAAVIVTFTLRTSAVCNGNRTILAFLGVIGFACVILDVVHVAYVSCGGSPGVPNWEANFVVNAAFVTLMCGFEFAAAGITITRCIQVLGREMFRRQGFFYLLLEQGMLYFIFTSLFTVTATVLTHLGNSHNFLQRWLNALVLPLSCLLTARFILHLRAWEAIIQSGCILDPSQLQHWAGGVAGISESSRIEDGFVHPIRILREHPENYPFFSTLAHFGSIEPILRH